MLKTISNGQSIHRYIRPDLKRMFYKNPSAIHASHNGKDPYGFLTNGLVLYLPLWALKGGSFKSVDAYRHTCSVTGALWGPDGRLLDGSDDYIGIADNVPLSITDKITVEVWCRIEEAATNDHDRIVFKEDAYGMFLPSGGLTVYWRISTGTVAKNSSTVTLVQDEWCMLQGIYDKVGVELYKDTVHAGAGAATAGAIDDTAHSLGIGGRATVPDRHFKGSIGEVRIYNRALSVAEMAHNYNVTKWRYQ